LVILISPREGGEIEDNMPFRSKKQRAWMQINKPKLYKKWKKKYGSKIVKKKK